MTVATSEQATIQEQHGTDEQQQPFSEAPLLVPAVCHFADGDRHLYATQLSVDGAFLLALRQPTIGTRFAVDLCLDQLAPLTHLECLVIGVRIDPAEATRSGFEVVFTHLDDVQLRRLSQAVSCAEAGRARTASRGRRRVVHERRMQPRVQTDLRVTVDLPEGAMELGLANLSMTGALLTLGKHASPASIVLGAKVDLCILAPAAPESVSVTGVVTRFTGPTEPPGFGVLFVRVDTLTAARIEGLLIETLVRGENGLAALEPPAATRPTVKTPW